MRACLGRQHWLKKGRRSFLSFAYVEFAFLILSLTVSASSSLGQQTKPSEYQIKAVYLYNFSRFIAWPGQRNSATTEPFVVCVLGRDPFGSALDSTLSGEQIDGRRVVAKRISKPQDSSGCQIIFVSSSEESHVKEILTALEGSRALTVSDLPRFSQEGGMIQFLLDGDKVRFEVNLKTATDAGLTLSSELLKVAVTVRRNTSTEE